ncbi:MAG: thermonuclease family protein [Proteobacteria bacterium]|nr:thermonuclease family protein [Pseudomonadota bacterium]
MKQKLFICALLSLLLCRPLWAEQLVVKKVLSGELIKLSGEEKVRYIGVDAPGEENFFFEESRQANKKLVDRKQITIEYDVRRKDGNGDLLGYVYAGDVFVNVQLLKNGFGIAYIVPPNQKYADLFISLQKEARKKRRGIWAFEDPNDEAYYIASKGSRKFHRPNCRFARELSFDKRVIFRTKDEALSKGYSQDWRCNPLFKRQEKEKK